MITVVMAILLTATSCWLLQNIFAKAALRRFSETARLRFTGRFCARSSVGKRSSETPSGRGNYSASQ